MKTVIFFAMVIVAGLWLLCRYRLKPSRTHGCIDAIVPAYNEEICIVATASELLKNRYINRVIVVNDGSTDGTAAVLDRLAQSSPRLTVIHQVNTGKGGALMNGIANSQADYVLLTDADTLIPPHRDDIGFLLAEMEKGADAVGGIPASNLNSAGLLPHIRATVKLPMIALKRTFQQIVGGAPFLISGACGLFRREVLLNVPFSDRTKVEDLDLTWSLVAAGYKVRQCSRCIVYSQECNSLKSEWLRWRRWIIGYAVCMRLHRSLLLTRFGLFSVLPMFAVVVIGIMLCSSMMIAVLSGEHPELLPIILMFPWPWVAVVTVIAAISALHYRRFTLVLLAPTAVFYVLLSYSIWLVHGFRGLISGKEPAVRDKPLRYAHVVD